jgi:hypothetical protein
MNRCAIFDGFEVIRVYPMVGVDGWMFYNLRMYAKKG